MKEKYLTPELKIIFIQPTNVLNTSYEIDPEDPWSKDY